VTIRPVLRRCVSCRRLLDRSELWRIVRCHDGGVALDKGMGRSAYLCRDRACLEEAKRRKRLQRALRAPVEESLLMALEGRLANSSAAASEAR
jgi:predicted RNA-binding protein YlxR (DUF448 family)